MYILMNDLVNLNIVKKIINLIEAFYMKKKIIIMQRLATPQQIITSAICVFLLSNKQPPQKTYKFTMHLSDVYNMTRPYSQCSIGILALLARPKVHIYIFYIKYTCIVDFSINWIVFCSFNANFDFFLECKVCIFI